MHPNTFSLHLEMSDKRLENYAVNRNSDQNRITWWITNFFEQEWDDEHCKSQFADIVYPMLLSWTTEGFVTERTHKTCQCDELHC